MSEQVTILVVDDSLVNLAVLDEILDRQGFKVVLANSGERAVKIATESSPDLVLLDVMMPGWDGYETCRHFKDSPELKNIPILFLSGLGDTENKVRALQSGGVDYVSKPFQEEELLARVHTHAELARLRAGLESEVAKKTAEVRSLLEALQLSYQKAQEASVLKTQFLRNISHEFRTPMNIILGTVDELMEDTALDEEQMEMAKTVSEAGNSLMDILTNMLNFSKQFEGETEQELERFDLYKHLNGLRETCIARASPKGIEMSFEVPALPGLLHGNIKYILEVLKKLLDNAISHTNQGYIKVIVDCLEESKADVLLRFRVIDSGIGIPAEKRQHLFETFSQVDGSSTREHDGMGMGLALSKLYVETMGGEIGLEDDSGQGCAFWFTLRLDKAGAEQDENFAENGETLSSLSRLEKEPHVGNHG